MGEENSGRPFTLSYTVDGQSYERTLFVTDGYVSFAIPNNACSVTVELEPFIEHDHL